MTRTLALLLAAITAAAPAPEKEAVAAPEVTLEAVAERNRLQTDDRFFRPASIEKLTISFVILNKSDRSVQSLELELPSGGFEPAEAVVLPGAIPPYGSFKGQLILQPRVEAGYGHREVLLLLRYRWMAGAQEIASTTTATIGFDVKRPFEDEAAGLPGGTAALFSLLLPVLCAFFTYEFFDRLRKGETPLPSFGSEYILPAFFIGLVANAIGLRYPRGAVLAGAAIAGAVWPLLRWGWELFQRSRWAFTESDSDPEYLRKALLGPRAPRRFVRVTGQLGGETWSGIRLHQPDGSLVLGAALQITPASSAHRETTQALIDAINGGAGKQQRRRLIDSVATGNCTLAHRQKVEQGGSDWNRVVAVEEVAALTVTKVERAVLLTVTT